MKLSECRILFEKCGGDWFSQQYPTALNASILSYGKEKREYGRRHITFIGHLREMFKAVEDAARASALSSISRTMKSINNLKGRLNKYGFDITRIRVQVSITPAVGVEIRALEDSDWEGLHSFQDLDSTQQSVINVLTSLDDVRLLMREHHHKLDYVEFIVGLQLPSVQLGFRPIRESPMIKDQDDATRAGFDM